ncbi:hypothetical protein MACK_001130 [Theileria orientalis]|uniref:Uncharacterized protein n=1 Tax=Theileria orientalis TaxID=68886 RepID=A0A976MCG9_THEOR|nr:hypothetical protein MACK_001130 [Theileria orientalis]
MADINLDQKENTYENENSSVQVNKEICNTFDSFEKVEVYYSKNHPNIPLILGFKRDEPDEFTYYTFLFLKYQSYHTGFPSKNYFYSGELEEKLKQENDKRNKIKFVVRKVGSVDYDEKEDNLSFNDYMKCTYSPKDDEKSGDYEFSSDLLFKKEAEIYLDSAFFNELNDHKFEFINVYYIKTSKIALLVEFINGSSKKFFSRKDINGTYWSEKTINYEESSQLENHLKDIKSEFQNWIAYQLDKKSNDKFYKYDYIKVSSYNYSGFTVVTHTPSENLKSKSPFVLFRKSLLEVHKTQQISGSNLDNIHKKTYHSINVNYYNSQVQGKNVNINVPFFLELRENSTNNRYYLLRLDKEGVKWKEVDNVSVNLSDPSKKQPMIRHINYYSNWSIMVIINYNGIIINQYTLHTVENLFNKDGQITKHSSAKIIIDQSGNLSGSTYIYCEHQFSHSLTLNGDDNSLFLMAGLRLYISDPINVSIDHSNSIEIKTYNTSGSAREILYNESDGKKTKLYVYFRGQTNMPLLVQHGDTFYKPYSKEQYLYKWVQVADLKGSRPDDSNTKENIINKLNEINTNFNDIDISKNNVGGYGIKNIKESEQGKEYYELVNKTFSGKRIDVKQEKNKYIKSTHSTIDKSRMGEILYKGTHLQNESNQSLSTELKSDQYNTVVVHYHVNDSSCLTPLLIKVGSTTKSSSLFYERITKESNINWKKVGDTTKLQSDGVGLENKINKIHYNLNNSLKIQLEHHEKTNYLIKLVKNLDSSDIQDVEYGKVNVFNEAVSSLESKYTSYKHIINYSELNELKDVGGIRLYIYDNEISIYSNNGRDKCPIYFDPSIKEVCVYFFGINKVPLLVCYNNKYYAPSSRDQYFQKWALKTDITHESQIHSNLDKINKILNQIDISETKHNTKYGIPKLSKANQGLYDEFYNRVSVTSCKSKHFIKVTHTTNYGFIGSVMYGLQPTNISPDDADHETNKLCLYYDSQDKYFTKPLLIQICCSTNNDICHWYSRTSADILNWKNELEKDKYNSYYNLEKELILIKELFVRLLVQIDKQGTEYYIIATKGNDSTSNNHVAQISLNSMETRDSIKVISYRFYYHSLSHYYQDNKRSILSKFGLTDNSDLELEIVIQIFDRTITLVDSNERPLNPPLTFTKTDNDRSRVLFVYFYESESLSNYQTDKIPLLIHYRTSFYAPLSKDSYFEKWKKVFELSDLQSNRLLGSQGLTNGSHQGNHNPEQLKKEILKKELDKINKMLNEIHTSKHQDYGLPFCGQPFYNKRGGPNSKRITVKKHKNNNYVMYVHTTSNGYEIGAINTGSTKLDDHKKDNENKSIELAAIFGDKDLSNPEILLVNEKKAYGDGSSTNGYYYKTNNKSPFNYKFTKLKYGFDLMNKLQKGSNFTESDVDGDLSDIKGILNKIITEPMRLEPIQNLDTDMEECKEEMDNGFELETCREIVPPKPEVNSILGPIGAQGDRAHNGLDDSDPLTVVQQQQRQQHMEPSSVVSSVPGPQSHPQAPQDERQSDHLESNGKTHVISEPGDLNQEFRSPEASVDSHTEAHLGLSQDDQESSKEVDKVQHREASQIGVVRPEGSDHVLGGKSLNLESSLPTQEQGEPSLKGRSSINENQDVTQNGLSHDRQLLKQQEGLEPESGEDGLLSGHRQGNELSQSIRNEVPVSASGDSNDIVSTGGYSQTEKESPNDIGEQIKKFIEDNKEAVYGGGGTVVTAGSSAYPLYKGITKLISK